MLSDAVSGKSPPRRRASSSCGLSGNGPLTGQTEGGAARARGEWPRPVARRITGSERVRAATPTPTALKRLFLSLAAKRSLFSHLDVPTHGRAGPVDALSLLPSPPVLSIPPELGSGLSVRVIRRWPTERGVRRRPRKELQTCYPLICWDLGRDWVTLCSAVRPSLPLCLSACLPVFLFLSVRLIRSELRIH